LTERKGVRYSLSFVATQKGTSIEEKTEMIQRRTRGAAVALAGLTLALLPACRKKPVEINPIQPAFTVNRQKAPLESAIEVTYTWTLAPNAKKLTQDYRALVHFLDPHKTVLFQDDHVPTPPPTSWEPGKSYSYKRTVFIPVYPYVGPVRVAMGLYTASGKPGRVALEGEDLGLNAYKVGTMDLQPKQDNLSLVYKEGWYNPESRPDNPAVEMTWSKRDAVVSFKNPKKDVILYVEGDSCFKCFSEPPVLTISVGGKTGLTVPIESGELFLKKIRFKASDLGASDFVDVHFTMNQSFVPKSLGMNDDVRELGFKEYHIFVGEADTLGDVPGVVDAGAVTVPAEKGGKPAAGAAKPGAAPPAKSPAPAKAASPAAAKSPSPAPKKS
jgi:hypothetical protein